MNVAAAEFKPTYTTFAPATLGSNVMKPNTSRAKAPEFIPARRIVDSKNSAAEVSGGMNGASVPHSSLIQGQVNKLSISEPVVKKSTLVDIQSGSKAKPGKVMKGADEQVLSLPSSNKRKETKYKGGSRQKRVDHEKENGHNKGTDCREKITKVKTTMENIRHTLESLQMDVLLSVYHGKEVFGRFREKRRSLN